VRLRSGAQSLSAPLQSRRRLLRSPRPAPLWASLTVRFPFLKGGIQAYHVPRECPCGGGLASSPVVHYLRSVSEEHLDLTTCPVGSSLSAPLAGHQ
jgi:hypothetical protein